MQRESKYTLLLDGSEEWQKFGRAFETENIAVASFGKQFVLKIKYEANYR